jgi:fatty acid desaturase
MFQYIRSVAEHFGDLAYEDDLSSSRTVMPSLLERFLIAPHHVGYHLEHHLYPGVPYYNLPKLHQLLMKQEEYKVKAHITIGYMSGLLRELGQVAESKNFHLKDATDLPTM